MSSGSYIGKTYMMKKGKCNVCKKSFTHNKNKTLIGKLGPIPIDLCKVCFPKIMKLEHLPLNDERK